ncbi:MAG: hypothetical protein JNL34_04850 [Anaerolineae bacterium]|nr:hypothetical protein [Anaerolineae bacterium]
MTAEVGVAGVSRRRSLAVWLGLWLIAVLALIGAVGIGRAISGEPALLPLDDAYIHLQYARQLAAGQPYVYNPGLPPTSGATSFLYPYLLAAGALAGADGLTLGIWAIVLGAAALALAGWLILRIGLAVGAPFWPSALVGLSWALSGAALWHAASGMETSVAVLAVLLAAYGVAARSDRWTLVGAGFAAVIRPEWAIVTLLAVALLGWRWWRGGLRRSWRWAWLLVPLALIGLQPLVNLLFTGSMVPSGNVAKSIFGAVNADFGVLAARWFGQIVRMGRELVTDWLAGPLVYVALPVLVMAVLGAVALARRRESRPLLVLIFGTLLLGAAAIATLDTAFWHFKRYQMPLFALIFVLAAGAALWFPRRGWIAIGLAGLALASSLLTVPVFIRAYVLNVGYVNAQPLPMARWLAANAPEDAVVAVHDVGMMRFLGGRTTLDMVGLTTAGAADFWRNGPGSVAEFLDRERPDLVASYGEEHGLGLGYLEATSLYGEELARFTAALDPALNVALAAESQAIFRPDYAPAGRAQTPLVIPARTRYTAGMEIVDAVDVADIISERAHAYSWVAGGDLGGFPTEVYQFGTLGCLEGADCTLVDGGRRMSGEEHFTLDTEPGRDLVLITRLHPGSPGQLGVYANGERIATRVVPNLPGGWLEVPVLIAGEKVGDSVEIRIVPETPGMIYQPYLHWAYQGNDYQTAEAPETPVAVWQDGAIQLGTPLLSWSLTEDGRTLLDVRLPWWTDGAASGDFAVFVHVLSADGEILTQADQRPGGGGRPPGNWLEGGFSDTITLDLTGIELDESQLALGLYDPVTLTPLIAEQSDNAGRVFIGTAEPPAGFNAGANGNEQG